jgi:hypothetical protein
MKRIVLLIGALAALTLSTGIGKATAYTPLDQATATHDADTGVGTGDGSSATFSDDFYAPTVDPATVAAEDGVPLSVVYGTCTPTIGTFCPSSTTMSSDSTSSTDSSGVTCWSIYDNRMATHWGIIPYQQVIAEHRHWCAHVGFTLTYVSSNVHAWSNYLCSAGNLYDEHYSGGKGYAQVTRTTGATFNCPILGFFPFYRTHWQRWKTTDTGEVKLVSRG